MKKLIKIYALKNENIWGDKILVIKEYRNKKNTIEVYNLKQFKKLPKKIKLMITESLI